MQKGKGIEASMRQFFKYVDENPRCLYHYMYWGSDREVGMRAAGGGSFVGQESIVEAYEKYVLAGKRDELREELYRALVRVLGAAGPLDNSTEIRDVCFCMYDLYPERAVADINRFFEAAEKEKSTRYDLRIEARYYVLKHLRDLEKKRTQPNAAAAPKKC